MRTLNGHNIDFRGWRAIVVNNVHVDDIHTIGGGLKSRYRTR